MHYDIIIGIETHIQLKTHTKMFCSCLAGVWQATPNAHVCPVCLGLPGALPVPNKAALDLTIRMGLALGATITTHSKFDRKNYFYPDLAKGYQISQYDEPLCLGGAIELSHARIGLIRAHLEEDVGKLTHAGAETLIDFNKGGTPLLEIVSEPVIHSSAEAKEYVQALRQLARYLEVNEGNMEQGTLRADVNISLQAAGRWSYQDGVFQTVGGYQMNNRVEIKNLNSFRNIERAIDYEVERQRALLDDGQTIDQETRGWDEVQGRTLSQRSKEEAHDYRYFPEPDIPPLLISIDWVEKIRKTLPELPADKRRRFQEVYGLPEYEARLLTAERALAEWFERAVSAATAHQPAKDAAGPASTRMAKTVANWMLGELARLQNETQVAIDEAKLQPEQLAKLLALLDSGKISAASTKEVLGEIYRSGGDPETLIKERGLAQVSGSTDLEPIAQRVIAANPEVVERIRQGKTSAVQFLVGQVMKETSGRANPAVVREVLARLLS